MTPAEEVRDLWRAARHEVNYRTVASRAYYAAFNKGMSVATRYGYAPVRTGADHIGMADFLRRQFDAVPKGNLLYRVGATLLVRSKRLRVHADYDPTTEFRRASGESAVELMNEIMDCFDQVEARPPE